MKIIPTRMHVVLDYAVALLLIALPLILRFDHFERPTYVMVGMGIATIIYSLLTDYEYSLRKIISMRTHLLLDGIAGLLLAVSPWLFGFSHIVYLPFVVIGCMELLVVMQSTDQAFHLTSNKTESSQRKKTAHS